MRHHRYLSACLLILSTLLQRGNAEDCLDYCLNCRSDASDYRSPNVTQEDGMEVSLQTDANGTLRTAQITIPSTYRSVIIQVNEDGVVLQNSQPDQRLSLPSQGLDAFSWVTLVLAPAGEDNLLIYFPDVKYEVITANVKNSSYVFASSSHKIHVAFNCLTGCLIRDSLSANIGNTNLQPNLTMYLNPISAKPFLTLASAQGDNVTLDKTHLTSNTWFRMKLLKTKMSTLKTNKTITEQKGKDGVREVLVWVTQDEYVLEQLEGLKWTLHCAPEGLLNSSFDGTKTENNNGNTDQPLTHPPDTEGNEGGKEGEGDNNFKRKAKGTAGAGQVAAWVLAGLAVFLVMILAFALCTRTAKNSQPQHVQDNQPSVGTVYFKKTNREPEEDSEPGTPNELRVPGQRNSFRYSLKEKIVQE